MRSSQIGQIASATGSAVGTGSLADGDLSIAVGTGTAVDVGASVAGALNGQEADSAYAKVNAINAAGVSGLTATAANSHSAVFDTITAAGGDSSYSLVVNGVDIYSGQTIADGSSLTVADVAAQINLYSGQTGVSASVSGTSLTLSSIDGRNTEVTETIGANTADTGIDAAQQSIVRGTITLSASDNIVMTENGGAAPLAAIGHAATISKDAGTLNSVDVLTVDNSETAINRIDSALTVVSELRSSFGAIQNRFESTIANLQAVSENLAASRGRIQDADFAAETASLTKAQILQQAGVAVLSQANAQPQLALSLLQ